MRALCAIGLLAGCSGQALAAAPDENPQSSTEIIVTGERLSQPLKNTQSSVAVFSRKDIEAAAGADQLEQILSSVPNVQLGSRGDGPTIRGQDSTGVLRDLPAFLGGARPRATLQVDGRAVTYNEFAFGTAPLWDVERVEVFRSPQTTTQGRNSIGGAIFVETADPTSHPEGRARLIVGDARTRQLSALASGPLVGDQLAVRISGDVRRSRTSSRLRGNIADVHLNRDEYAVLRAKLLATPAALPGLRLLLTYAHTQSDTPQVEGIRPPYEEREDDNVTSGYFSTDVDSLTARATYDISPSLQSRTTLSWGDADIQRFAPAGFGETTIAGKDFSAESVAEWNPSQQLRLLGGVHLLSNELDQRIDLSAAGQGIGLFRDEQRSVGLFGEARWQPAPRVTLTGGLRYQHDAQDRDGGLDGPRGIVPLDFRGRFDAFLPKVSLAYDLNPDLRVGALVQRAYNPGGVTIDFRTRAPDTFDAETLWDYELFFRADLFGSAISLAGNLFYNDIKDAQRQVRQELVTPAGVVSFAEISNAPSAHSYGAEVELRYRPTRRLDLRAGVGLLETIISETEFRSDPLRGQSFNRSPGFTGSAAIDWMASDRLRVSGQVRHHGAYYSDDANTPLLRVGGATVVDARAEWQARNFRIFGYVRNLLDSFRLTYRFALAADGRSVATAEDPREVGLGITADF